MISGFVLWRDFSWPLAGLLFLVIGLIAVRRQLSATLDAVPVLGRVFVPVALAAFGAEHFSNADNLVKMVPSWMPARLFWVYFVGVAHIAAATSISLGKQVRLSAPLLGSMFFIFVLSIHLPIVLRNPGSRFAWSVALRDLLFGAGAWALAGTATGEGHGPVARRAMAGGRVVFAVVLFFFGVEHVLHPGFAPGVPLEQSTPEWMPLRSAWGSCIGAALLATGVAVLIDKHARAAATWLGVAVTLLVLLLYLPMLAVSTGPSGVTVALNDLFDTLLFAGTILLFAESIPAAQP
jgi:uncharacterized membrane protein